MAIVAGAILIGHPFYTDVQAGKAQTQLAKDLQTASARQDFELNRIQEHSPVTRLRIPRLGVDTVVVEGTSKEALDVGAGHYPETPLPGSNGNVAIAGHRTTYGKPFADLDQLQTGDRVELDTPIGQFVYEMVAPFDGHANPWVIRPDDWTVIAKTDKPMLTLTTCHPKRSAAQRLVARFQLVEGPGGEEVSANTSDGVSPLPAER